MRAFGVVPDEPVDEEFIEPRKIVTQRCSIVLDEIFGERSVESFDVSIHLRRSRVRMVAGNLEFLARIIEVACKFRAVVGLERHSPSFQYR